ncbi:kinase domain protein, putative (macronuclear) [Tetrahymena thermophila SB210]|uniref:Kinase domain protein, putative n=1 Tax=Tetrahymena thermophila (strain SB210) TaxID=312017 RepID=I7M355_TETTS|nr:kinase domain protein, putative [Tetrahymena thermophila SB210]EAS02175.2 kinase domain protein, putative [Tetrahymena thermophila SB210]|eukprot:XP_001022420.2 kinase domain protein, putative [Tetrahymena thermophila SB210]
MVKLVLNPMNCLQRYEHYSFKPELDCRIYTQFLIGENATNSKKFVQSLQKFKNLDWLSLNFSAKLESQDALIDGFYDDISFEIYNLEIIVFNQNLQETTDFDFKIFELIQDCKQIQLLTINLYCCQIGDEGMNRLSKVLYLPQLIGLELKLQGNQLQNESFVSLQQLLVRHQNLKYLNLRLGYNTLSSTMVEKLIEILQGLHKLEKLVLFMSHCMIQNQGAQLLLEQLAKMKQLRHLVLDLERNSLRHEDGNNIPKLFRTLNQLYSFNLNLSMNHLQINQSKINNQIRKTPHLVIYF